MPKVHAIVTKSTVSSRVCWSLKVLWGSVSADFRQFQVGGEGKKDCSLAAISGKDSPTHAASNSRSPFPHLCTEKLSRTCCTCSRGGSLFLHYRIQPHLLSPLIMVRLKMTYLEIFQSNIVKYTTNRYVDCNAVSWFSLCS